MNEIWMKVIEAAIPLAVPVLVVGIGWLFVQIGKLIRNAIKKSDTQLDDKIAAWCVAWAEDKLGGGKGEEKLDEACDKIVELTKGRINHDQPEVLIRAAYQGLYGELKNLKNG